MHGSHVTPPDRRGAPMHGFPVTPPDRRGAPMRGCLVTATDTGVGKTVLACAVLAGLAARGERVAALKPAVTGLDEPVAGVPDDHELLAACAGTRPDEVAPHRFGPAVSPHLAADLAGRPIDVPALIAGARRAAALADALIVEGVGGLLVPLGPGWDLRAFARELGLPVIVAARPGLGTINHTLLTLEAARAAGLDVRAVVLTPWPDEPGTIELSNRETIGRLGAVAVATLPRVAPLAPAQLAAAGALLPLDAWIGQPGLRHSME